MSVRRVRLPLAGVEELARRAGDLRLPWQRAGVRPMNLAATLGGHAAERPERGDTMDPLAAPRAVGMLDDDRVVPEARAMLSLLCGARILVDLDLAVVCPEAPLRSRRLHSWHRLHDQAFVAASTADARTVELVWGPRRCWDQELSRIAAVTPLPASADSPPARVDVPWEVLLSERQARHDRDRMLHRLCLGRLGATATRGDEAGRRTLGMVSWLLFADGWRALTPYSWNGRRVRLDAVDARALGGQLRPLIGGSPR